MDSNSRLFYPKGSSSQQLADSAENILGHQLATEQCFEFSEDDLKLEINGEFTLDELKAIVKAWEKMRV